MAVRGALLFLRSKYRGNQNNKRSSDSSKETNKPKERKQSRLHKKKISSSTSSSSSFSSSPRPKCSKSHKDHYHYPHHHPAPDNLVISSPKETLGSDTPDLSLASSPKEIIPLGFPDDSPEILQLNSPQTPSKANMVVKLTSPSSSSVELPSALKNVPSEKTDSEIKTINASPVSHPSQELPSKIIPAISATPSLSLPLPSSPSHVIEKPDQFESASPQLSIPKAPSFWKRISQARSPTAKKTPMDVQRDIPRAFSDPELHTIKAISTIPAIPEPPVVVPASPTVSDTPNPSCQAVSPDLAGVGVRDRRSIAASAFSSSSKAPTSFTKTHKSRPISNFSPATSSPLSSQADFEDEILSTSHSLPTLGVPHPHHHLLSSGSHSPALHHHPLLPTTTTTTTTTTTATRPRIGGNHRSSRSSYHKNRLSFIPDGSAFDSGDLMRILRGPSAYPAEARPRSIISSSSFSAPNSRPTSRSGLILADAV